MSWVGGFRHGGLKVRLTPGDRAFRGRLVNMTPAQRQAMLTRSQITQGNTRDAGRADAKLRKF